MHYALRDSHLLYANIWRVEEDLWYSKPLIIHANDLQQEP